ncbi:uncharacterized protein LOC123327159 [Drosophila simulans]|uniref:uncharacterized protein LOC123327159 n=1 Tax=Drosophila simulans TaxID=7240 RepID=UPI001D1171E2|nr:uncharacterized protein LOC123327159 [Drosophila simulans]
MDDLITGADTVNECYELQRKLRQVMEKGGMHLRKWVANDERILADIQDDGATEKICIEENESIETLGLQWDPKKDTFTFSAENPMLTRITKRGTASSSEDVWNARRVKGGQVEREVMDLGLRKTERP